MRIVFIIAGVSTAALGMVGAASAQPASVARDIHCGGVWMAEAEMAATETTKAQARERAAVFIRRAQEREPLLDIDEMVDEEVAHVTAMKAEERAKLREDCAAPAP